MFGYLDQFYPYSSEGNKREGLIKGGVCENLGTFFGENPKNVG